MKYLIIFIYLLTFAVCIFNCLNRRNMKMNSNVPVINLYKRLFYSTLLYFLFYSNIFYPTLFNYILIYSTLFDSTLFYSIIIYSILY